MTELRLCYADACWAWFTTAPLDEQDGDDWDDAPYEHNAGDPYQWRPDSGREPYQLYKVGWDGDFVLPSFGYLNSPFSVQHINQGVRPWLAAYDSGVAVVIQAGESFEEFVRLIGLGGGRVYQAERTHE